MSDQDIFSGVHEVAVDPPGPTGEDAGLVVRWRHRGGLWEGLVSHEVDGKVTTEWLPAISLTPSSSP